MSTEQSPPQRYRDQSPLYADRPKPQRRDLTPRQRNILVAVRREWNTGGHYYHQNDAAAVQGLVERGLVHARMVRTEKYGGMIKVWAR